MKGGEEVVGGKWWEDDFNGDETVCETLSLPLEAQMFLFTSTYSLHRCRISTFLLSQPFPHT